MSGGGGEDTGGGGGGKGDGGGGSSMDTEYGSGWGADGAGGFGDNYSAPAGGVSPDDWIAGNRGGGGGYDTSMTGGSDPFPSIGGGGYSAPDPGGYSAPSIGTGGGGFDALSGGGGYDIPNLGGSGPVGGVPGQPDAGGGTNTWGNLPGLSGNEFDYLGGGAAPAGGAPSIATGGGVSSYSASDGSSAGPISLDEIFNTGGTGTTTGSMTPGPSAAATAAPAGVSGIGDLTISGNEADIFDAGGRDTNAGGTSSLAAARSPGLLEQLGLTGGTRNNLGLAAAAAGLANNLISGSGSTESADALRGLATQNAGAAGDVRARSAERAATGGQVTAAGQQQIAQGQTMTQEGQAHQQWLRTGTLPPAYETQVQQGVQSAVARIRANHASRGMPTDPARNSVLAEEIRQVEARAPEMRMQLAQSLAQTGSSIVGAGNQTIGTGGSLVNQGTQTADSLIDEGLRSTGLSADIYRALLTDENATNQRRGQAIGNFAAALNNTPRRAA